MNKPRHYSRGCGLAIIHLSSLRFTTIFIAMKFSKYWISTDGTDANSLDEISEILENWSTRFSFFFLGDFNFNDDSSPTNRKLLLGLFLVVVSLLVVFVGCVVILLDAIAS